MVEWQVFVNRLLMNPEIQALVAFALASLLASAVNAIAPNAPKDAGRVRRWADTLLRVFSIAYGRATPDEARQRQPLRKSKRALSSVAKSGLVLLAMLPLVGCGTLGGGRDVLKEIESGAYDSAAEMVSGYCERMGEAGKFVQRTRIEARREIRQRGTHGPPQPAEGIPGLDDKTAAGPGPLLLVYCAGDPDALPAVVWRERYVRDWRD